MKNKKFACKKCDVKNMTHDEAMNHLGHDAKGNSPTEKVFTCPETQDLTGTCHLCGEDISGHGADYECLSPTENKKVKWDQEPFEDRKEVIAAHTPTPWKVREYKYGKDYTGVIETMDGIYLGEMSCTMGQTKKEDQTPIANAAYIIRAVNAHEDLVTALKASIKLMESKDTSWSFHEDIFIQMREAIAKAEGK